MYVSPECSFSNPAT